MLKVLQKYNPKECCGCRACEQVCTHHAITMKVDGEGFLYPTLDEKSCVDCGLCETVCPMQNAAKTLNCDGAAYAAQNKCEKDLLTSSSGGMFIVIAKHIIGKGGIVYGAAYDGGTSVCHQRVETEEELERFKGSKYVQSDTAKTYSQVRKDLREGRYVYYTGTPCQIAGLKLFLRKDYPLLITSDLVCHGTPSHKIFDIMVQHMQDEAKAQFVDYSFRDKKTHGWACSSSSSYKKPNGKILYVKYSRHMEAYFKAFITGDLMRWNCYQCPFARYNRVGDITIADYWNVKKAHPEFPNISNGVSLVMVNTRRGDDLLKDISDNVVLMNLAKEEAMESNWNLRQPTPLTEGRQLSYELAFCDYDAFVKKYYKGNYVKDKLKTEVEYFIRKHKSIFSVASFIKRHI